LPWFKQLLRAGEIFSQRLDFGTAADTQRALMLEQGNLKQRQLAEYQELLKQQGAEIRLKQTELSKIQTAIKPPPNAAALEQKINQDLAELKQVHTKKIRAVKQLHQEQLKQLKISQSELMKRATSTIAQTTDYLKKAAETESIIDSTHQNASFRVAS